MGYARRVLACLGMVLWITGGLEFVVPTAASDQIVLQPGPVEGKDIVIAGIDPDVNYGAYERLVVNESIGSGDYRARSLIQFDLSGTPAETMILSATCALYFYDSDPLDREHTVGAYRIVEDWTESGATWNNASDIYDPSYCYDIALVAGANYGWYSWDVTQLVQEWVNGTYPNHGMMFKCIDGNSVTQGFHSSDAPAGNLRPKLTITYVPVSDVAMPAVSNVHAEQRQGTTGTGTIVDINYALEDADSDSADVTIQVSNDGGNTFTVPAQTFTGDVGRVAKGQDKQVAWYAGQDVPDVYWPECQVKVTTRDMSVGPTGEGLVGYWPFDGNANDESGNGNQGTVYGATLTEDRFGVPNSAYSFDGIDDYIDVGNDSRLKPGLPITVAAWMKINGIEGDVLTTNFAEGSYYGILVTINNGGLHLNFGDGSSIGSQSRRSKSIDVPVLGTWFHFVGIIQGAQDMDIYIDGENVGGIYSGAGGSIAYDDGPVNIGRVATQLSSPYFDGILDEVRIYDRALSEEEVQTLYQFSERASQAVTLQPGPENGKDAEVWDLPCETDYAQHSGLCESVNEGEKPYFRAASWTYWGDTGTHRSYVEFDLNGIYDERDIHRAQLYLYSETSTDQTQSGDNAFFVHRVIQDWDEDAIVWSNQPEVADVVEGRDFIRVPQSQSPTQDYVIDMTEMVEFWLADPSSNFGMRLRLETESPYRRGFFASSDFEVPFRRPKLVIRFADESVQRNSFLLNSRVAQRISVYLPGRESILIDRPRSLPVSVNNVTGRGLVSLLTVLTYDGTVIRPLDALTDGTLTEGWTLDFNVIPGANTPIDTFYVAMATDAHTLSGSGALFYINVAPAEGVSPGDTTVLHFESFRFNEDTTRVDTQDGVVYITERMFGDVTANEEITPYDAAWILQHKVGLRTLAGDDSVVADVSGDGTVSAYDAALVLQYTVRKISLFPVEEEGQAKIVYASRTVRIGQMERSEDGRLRLAIVIDDMSDVVAGEVSLSFSGHVGDVAVSSTDLTSDCLLVHNVQGGRIRASFAGAESRSGPGPVLEVVFDASDDDVLNSLKLERVFLNEGSIPARIVEDREIPEVYRLSQNYPNPFNPQTTIPYDAAKSGTVRLAIYALSGQRIRTLVGGERPTGRYSTVWDGTDDAGRAVGSGVYLCRMEAGDFRATCKVLLMR